METFYTVLGKLFVIYLLRPYCPQLLSSFCGESREQGRCRPSNSIVALAASPSPMALPSPLPGEGGQTGREACRGVHVCAGWLSVPLGRPVMGPAFLWTVSTLVSRPSKQVIPVALNVQNSLFMLKTPRSTRWPWARGGGILPPDLQVICKA